MSEGMFRLINWVIVFAFVVVNGYITVRIIGAYGIVLGKIFSRGGSKDQ
jgi:hypothetical protein